MAEKVVVSWSGGKDSVLALYRLINVGKYVVDSLLTTVTEGASRISIHGVREALLDEQARRLGIPLRKMYIPENCPNAIYQERMEEQLLQIKNDGIDTMVFGDIFLEDVRKYREDLIGQVGLSGLFPLWGESTDDIMEEFLSHEFKTVTTCVDTEALEGRFLGRQVDRRFLRELPSSADPCGENGEFHTFTYDGPIFNGKMNIRTGDVVDKGRFHFCELLGGM